MPSRPKANPSHISVVDLVERAVVAAQRHPGMVVLAGLILTILLYHAGILHPLDWWGDGTEVGR